MLASNAAANEWIDFGNALLEESNLLLWLMLDRKAHIMLGTIWAQEARERVALFRTAYDIVAPRPGIPRDRGPAGKRQRGIPKLLTQSRGYRVSVRHRNYRASDQGTNPGTYLPSDHPHLKLLLYADAGENNAT